MNTIIHGTKLTATDGFSGSVVAQDDSGMVTLAAIVDGRVVRREFHRDQTNIAEIPADRFLDRTPSENVAKNDADLAAGARAACDEAAQRQRDRDAFIARTMRLRSERRAREVARGVR